MVTPRNPLSSLPQPHSLPPPRLAQPNKKTKTHPKLHPSQSPRKLKSRTEPVPSELARKAKHPPTQSKPKAKRQAAAKNSETKKASAKEAAPRTQKQAECWKSSSAPAAVQKFFTQPRRLAECRLVRDLLSDQPVAHRRAAEMARLIGMREPGALAPYANLLAAVAAAWPIEEWQARQYALAAAALAAETHPQRMVLVPLVRLRLAENRIAVRAMALEAFALLAIHESELRDEALELLEHARRSSIPALRSRARLMLPLLQKPESPDPQRLANNPE